MQQCQMVGARILLICNFSEECGMVTGTCVGRVAVQGNLLPCCQQQAVSPVCAPHDAFTLAGSALDAQALKQQELLANLDELLTPVELRDIEELLMPEIDGGARILLARMLWSNVACAPVDRVAVQDDLLPCCQQQAASRICAEHDAFTLAEATPEGRLERAREIAGDGLLSEAAEKHPEAAFMVWMDNVRKSHTYRSQVRSAGPAGSQEAPIR